MSAVFRIRHRDTGLFSTGTGFPQWTRGGKFFGTLSALKNSLQADQARAYDRAEVVTYSATEVSAQDVSEVLAEIERAQTQREAKSAAWVAKESGR